MCFQNFPQTQPILGIRVTWLGGRSSECWKTLHSTVTQIDLEILLYKCEKWNGNGAKFEFELKMPTELSSYSTNLGDQSYIVRS